MKNGGLVAIKIEKVAVSEIYHQWHHYIISLLGPSWSRHHMDYAGPVDNHMLSVAVQMAIYYLLCTFALTNGEAFHE